MNERQPSLGLLILALMAACVAIWLWPSATSRHTESTTRSLAPPHSTPATPASGAQPNLPGASPASASGAGPEAARAEATRGE